MLDAKAFGLELAGMVKAQLSPVLDRLTALEKRLDALPVPKDGKDADPAEVAAMVREGIAPELDAMKAALADIPEVPEVPELPDLSAMIAEAVSEAVKAIPTPKDGQDGNDGSSVTVDDVMPALQDQVKAFLDAIPMPKDGKDGRDGADGNDGADGDKGEPGRDGLDVKDLFRADGGRLVAVMSDGTTKDLGQFVGADGNDGSDGKDGADGLGFDDMDFEADEHGRAFAKFQRGDLVKTVRLPGIVDRGVYKAGESYLRGDSVTWGGGLWIAQFDGVKGKPEADAGWRLAVKKGRDGKNA